MGQILHGSATTTEAVRRAIQNSQASLRVLARRYGINQKTVAKWKKRSSVSDLPTGPTDAKSSVLSVEEEAIIVAFRRHTLLPLDDCLYALQPTIPRLTRSSLHRCLRRHGISRLPEVEGDKPDKKKFKAYALTQSPTLSTRARGFSKLCSAFAGRVKADPPAAIVATLGSVLADPV
jgi:transposase